MFQRPMSKQKRRLAVEQLEVRRLLARDILYLDFDSTSGGPNPPGNLQSTYFDLFTSGHWQGRGVSSPDFLDVARTDASGRTRKIGDVDRDGTWDGDGILNRSDALVVRDKTVQYVRNLFKGLDVEIVSGSNGWGRLQTAKDNDDVNLYVMFVGGDYTTSSGGRLFGRTNQAPIGENNEWFGWVYAGNIADSMRGDRLFHNEDGRDLAWNIAVTAAHEFGHMLGLGHPSVPSSVFTDASDINRYCDADGRCRIRQNGPYEIFDPLLSVMSSGAKLRGTSFSKVDYSGWRYPIETEVYRRNGNNITEVLIDQAQRVELRNSFNDSQDTIYNARNSSGFNHDSNEVDLTFSSQTPNFPILPAGGNAAGSVTASTISTQLRDGLTQYRNQAVASLATTLNLPSDELVLASGAIADATGLTARLQSLIDDVAGLASANSMTSVRQSLEAAGYSIDYLITDGELAALDRTKPSNYVQVSRTFTLLNSKASTSLRTDELAALQFLKDVVGFSGNLEIEANAAIHVSMGIDSNGFYFSPGRLLESQFTLQGDVTGNIGNFGWVSGDATAMLAPILEIQANTADGKLRLTDVGNNSRMVKSLSYDGFASLEANAEVSVFDSNLLEFTGNWNWDLDETGFTYDSDLSGFDTESLRESILDLAAQGLDEVVTQASQLATITKNIPLVGDSIQTPFTDLIESAFSFDISETKLADYLSERGITVSSEIGVSDIFDGSFRDKSIVQFDFSRREEVSNAVSVAGTKAFAFNALGAPIEFQFQGNLSASPYIDFNVGIGLDASQGPYIVEGTGLTAALPVIGNVTGKAKIGSLVDIVANANVSLPASLAFAFDDGDATPNERLYLFSSFNLSDAALPPSNTTLSGVIQLNDLSLTAQTPASNIPVIGSFLDNAFSWRAVGSYDLATKMGSFVVDQNSLPSFSSIRDDLFRTVAGNLVDANPIPSDVGKVLGTPIAFLGNKTVADLIGMGGADLFLNPDAYKNRNADDAPKGDGITLNYDFAEPANIIAMLSGRDADYFSVTIDKTFSQSTTINVLPPTLLYSFFGLVNFTGRIDVIPRMSANVSVQVGLDSRGFYVADRPGGVLTLAGSIEARPALTGSLTIVPLAEVAGIVGIGARGIVDIVSPTGANKVRFNEIVSNGKLVTSNFDLSLELFMNIGLEGKVGILGSGLEAAGRVDKEFILFTYPGDSKQPGQDVFAKLKKDMENKGKAIVCVGGFAAGGVFGGVVACGIAYGQEILDAIDDGARWVGDRFNETVEGAKEIAGQVTSTAKKAVEDAVDTATEWRDKVANEVEKLPGGKEVLDFLDRLDDPLENVLRGGGFDYKKILGIGQDTKECRAISIANEISFSHSYVAADNTLYITPKNDAALDLVVSVIEGNLVIDAPDERRVVNVQECRTRKWKDLEFKYTDWSSWTPTGDMREVVFANMVRQPLQGLSRVVIEGSSKGDKIIAAQFANALPNLKIVVNGRDGNDLIVGGNGNDELDGGGDSDRIIGNGGNDVIRGGSGQDFLYGGTGSDTIDGGSGNDLIDDTEGNVARNEVNRLIGGPGEDQINGGPNRDLIEGGDDKDIIRGNGGNDEIYGGTGFLSGLPDTDNAGDFIDGGDGDDILDGGRGDDNLVGGANEDTLRGGPGNDVLYSHTLEDREGGNFKGTLDGGSGQDVIYGGAGIDRIVGGADADLIFGGGSGDTIYADNDGGAESSTDGNDIVFSGEGNDIVYLSGGGPALPKFENSEESEFRNYVAADAGIDTVYGGSGPDFIDVGVGDDEAFGGGGEDVLVGVSGRDRLNGDGGDDKLFAGSPENQNPGGILRGGSNNDELYGDSGDDELYGESGDDLLVTKTGENIAEGGPGDDDFLFGFGVDILRGDSDLDEFFLDNPTGTLALSAGEIQIFGGGQSGDTVYFRGGGNQQMQQTISMSPDKTLGTSKAQIPEGIQIVNFAGVGQLFDYSEARRLDYSTTNGSDQVSLDNGALGADQFAAINTNGFTRYEFRNKTEVGINSGLDQTDIADVIEVLSHDDMFGTNRIRALGYSGDDLFLIKATNPSVDYEFLGQSGNDQFIVSDSPVEVPGSTAGILGDVIIDSGEGAQNSLLIDDRLGAGHSVLLTDSTITGIAPVAIRYVGDGAFNRPNSSGLVLKLSHDDNDTVYVDSTRAGNSHLIEGFGGNDDVFVGVASRSENLGDLNLISGYVYFDGGAGNADRLFSKDDETSQNFDYRLEPGELRHLPNQMHPTRPFAGVGFGNIEVARLDASQGKNRLSVRPSLNILFIVDGNDPTAEDCTPGGGDHLALDLMPHPPTDASAVEDPSVTFTQIIDGKQQAGIWNFGSPHQPVNFESIESFNLLDKLAISSDAAWSASAGVRVISTVRNKSYSSLVTNFTTDDLVPFALPEFPTHSAFALGTRNNRLLAADVNNDSMVTPIDALLVINHLNKRASGTVGSSVGFVDVNGDGMVSPLDALLVINSLNREARPTVTFGGVRTTVADLNCDGVDEIIAVSGANHLPTLVVFNGITGALMASPQPLTEATGNFGTNIAAGDIDGDGKVEIITSSDRGAGEYSIWRWENGSVTKIADRSVAFSPGYLGGVRVTTGDLNGDGKSEIIVGSGTGTDASVRAYDANGVQLSSFVVAPSFGRGGVYVATGDYNGDGVSDLFVSSGRRGNSQIQVFNGVASLGNSIASSILISNVYTGQDAIAPINIALKDSDGDEEKELHSSQLSDGRSDQLKKWEFSKAADAFFSTLQSNLDPDWSSGAYLG
jgi:Ca2+-binding RTX toxin-like protein